MKFEPGDLVVYTEFESARRGEKNCTMLVLNKMCRLKREGDYYRVLVNGKETLCHVSHIRLLRKNENID